MRRPAVLALAIGLLATAGCARHVVVPREGGRIDGERSVASYGDTSWTIVREPAPAGAAGSVAPAPSEERLPAPSPAR